MPQSATKSAARTKILIYGINYAPEMIGVGRFTGEIGAYLAGLGYSLTVITAPPHYPGWRVPLPYRSWRYSREQREGANVLRCPLLLRQEMRGLWRLLAPLSFALSSAPIALWQVLAWRPALVLCVEPTFFVAPIALLAKLVGSKVVLHVQDLEIDAAFAVGHLKGEGLKKLVIKAESFLLSLFDVVITISGQMQKRLIAKGVDPGKTAVVRNWVDLGKIKLLEGPNRFRRELQLQDQDFVVLYAGNIGPKQSLDIVIDAARDLAGATRIHFVIAGEGPEKESLIRKSSDLPNVHFLALQPEERLCELLNLADLHVLPQSSGAADLVLPSKLGGMLASGKPVIATADAGTELFEVLRGTAILVPAGDSSALAHEIGALAREGHHPALGDGRALARSFERDVCLKQFHAAFGLAARE
jgi:colanic acid biosynthesis glycosyl transferase WcaI